MGKEQIAGEDKARKRPRPETREPTKRRAGGPGPEASGLGALQRRVGNRAVQRLLAQRRGSEPTEVDEETASRIDRERGGGQPLEGGVQQQASAALQQDFGGVRVHTSPEADSLNRQLGARAFTTGRDVFFRGGTYEPHSQQGRQLIAHELTHVVQQGTGAAGGAGRMTVNPPDDAFEKEAESVSQAVTAAQPGMAGTAGGEGAVRLQPGEEEEKLQMQEEEEEEEETLQTQAVPEEEELLQTQAGEEEEEEQV